MYRIIIHQDSLSNDDCHLKIVRLSVNDIFIADRKSSISISWEDRSVKMSRLGIVWVLLLSPLFASAADGDAEKFLLPGNLIPSYYRLHIDTYIDEFDLADPTSFRYDATQSIYFTAIEDNVTSIVINGYYPELMQVAAAWLIYANETLIQFETHPFDEETQKLIYDVEEALPKNEELVLIITFTGLHRRKDGFYSAYYEEGDARRYVLETHFQPAQARAAWPCFDEPKYKAIWGISVSLASSLVKDGYGVLSNAEIHSTADVGGRYNVNFEDTPVPLSSYLIAVVVSYFKSTPVSTFNSSYPDPTVGQIKEFRTWARPSYIDEGLAQTAQKVGPALMEIYTRNYDIGYAYNKVDQVAAPNAGGMENWGLIIYGESVLEAGEGSQSGITTLVAHELGHQWFGNLVTLNWWSDVWLNEGFATYVEYHGTLQLEIEGIDIQEWNLMELFIVKEFQRALVFDTTPMSHPLTKEEYHPDDLAANFDYVAYEKGGSIIRMWQHILGLAAFNKALRNYLKQTKEGLTTPEILLSNFDKVVDESASDFQGQLPSQIFKNWHLLDGYPLVNVVKSPNDATKYVLTQEKFIDNTKADEVWTIPISYSTSANDNFNNTQATHWLKENEPNTTITVSEPVDWIVLNNQVTGFFRINYDLENWDKLIEIISNPDTIDAIPRLNRMQLTDDAHSLGLSRKRYMPYDRIMRLTTYLKHETAYYPWKSALNNLDVLNRLLARNETVHVLFKKHLLSLMKDQYERLSFETKNTDTYQDRQLRPLLVSWLCKLDHPDCLSRTRDIFSNRIQKNVRSTVYCAGVRRGSKPVWTALWTKYLTTQDDSEKNDVITGLGCATDKVILREFLRKPLVKGSGLRAQDAENVLLSVYNGNVDNAREVFEFLSENYQQVANTYDGSNPLGKLLLATANGLADGQDIKKVDEFVVAIENSDDRRVRRANRSAKLVREFTLRNDDWSKKKSDQVYKWLKENY